MKRSVFFTFSILCSVMMLFAQAPKKVSILGDSYSTFEGLVQPDTNLVWYFEKNPYPTPLTNVNSADSTWWKIFIADNSYVLEKNNSYSGSTVCNLGYQKAEYSDRSFITRMNNLGNPDMILVFGATNDCWAKVPVGTDDSNDLYTFRPAMKLMLKSLPELYPNAEIHFILNDAIDGEIRQAVIDLCKQYNTDCIVLHDISKQTGHPDNAGMKQISRQLTDALK